MTSWLRFFRLLAMALGCTLAMPLVVKAEYRAFRLVITDKQANSQRRVLTTLDHVQYGHYFQMRGTEVAAIEDTWMCYRRSDHGQPICPSPRAEQAPTTSPSQDRSQDPSPAAPPPNTAPR